MDDFNANTLLESKNEFVIRLCNILTPPIHGGVRGIFSTAVTDCINSGEPNKYLLTFQNYLKNIKKWNNEIVNTETERILNESSCDYLPDLITSVHIIMLKLITCVRAGTKHKKVELNIPKINDFIHRVYIKIADVLGKNAYLFKEQVSDLLKLENNRKIETLIKECIANTVRDSVPIKEILAVYLEQTSEETVVVSETLAENTGGAKEQKLIDSFETVETITTTDSTIKDVPGDEIKMTIEEQNKEIVPFPVPEIIATHDDNVVKVEAENKINTENEVAPPIIEKPLQNQISFSDTDHAIDSNKNETLIEAPKTIERLEQISSEAHERRKLEEEDNSETIEIIDDVPLEDGVSPDLVLGDEPYSTSEDILVL